MTRRQRMRYTAALLLAVNLVLGLLNQDPGVVLVALLLLGLRTLLSLTEHT